MGVWLLRFAGGWDRVSRVLAARDAELPFAIAAPSLSPRMPLPEGKFLLGARKTATRSWKGSRRPRRETTGSTG